MDHKVGCRCGGMQISVAHQAVMGGWMVFCMVVGKICGAGHPINDKLALASAVLKPIKTHVDGFRPLLFDGVIDKALGSGVIHLEGRGRLWMSEFNKGCTDGDSLLAVKESGTTFGFGGGGQDISHNFGDGVDGSVARWSASGGLQRIDGWAAQKIVATGATSSARFR